MWSGGERKGQTNVHERKGTSWPRYIITELSDSAKRHQYCAILTVSSCSLTRLKENGLLSLKKAKNELEAKKGEKEPTASGTKRLACFSPPRLLLASDRGSRYTLQRRCLQSRSFVNIWFGLEPQLRRPSFWQFVFSRADIVAPFLTFENTAAV